MSIQYVTRRGVVMATLATLGVFAAIAHPATTATAARDPLTCSIEAKHAGQSVELQARVSAHHETAGSYRFRVVKSGGGSAVIDQSGEFAVGAGSNVVSTINLGGRGDFTARLSVTADGTTTECSQRVGGSI